MKVQGDIDPVSACEGKHGYPSPQLALAAISNSTKPERRKLKIYHCRVCGAWHYGRSEDIERRAQKEWKNWFWRRAASEP